MTKSLLKILDASVFPAALMVASKFLGLYMAIEFFGLDWGINNNPNQLISTRPVLYPDELVVASTYSDLFLLVVMISGFSFHIIRAVYFHASHISPRILVRLSVRGLLGLVKGSYEIYHRATIWLIFLWISLVTVLLNYFTEKTDAWVLLFGAGVSLLLTVIFIRDVIYEINSAKKSFGKAEI